MISERAVARAMLDFCPPPQPGHARPTAVSSMYYAPRVATARLSRIERSNSFLFGVLFDHMIRADQAWAAPALLAKRLGHLDVGRISRMPETELGAFICGREGEKALHRLWPRLTKNLIAASQHLVAVYDGDAENIWPDGIDVLELRSRLEAFPGLGVKLANMTIRLLTDHFGRSFQGWENADVAVDRHVARVFLRTGLVGANLAGTKHSLHALRDDILAAARRLSPSYPAALDAPAFVVGQQWCRARRAECRGCPLASVCQRRRRTWRLE